MALSILLLVLQEVQGMLEVPSGFQKRYRQRILWKGRRPVPIGAWIGASISPDRAKAVANE